jgi:hypothetical protein
MVLRIIPKEQIQIQLCADKKHIIAAFFADETKDGCYLHYEKYLLSDFPNNFASVEDFKRFGIDIINLNAVRCF